MLRPDPARGEAPRVPRDPMRSALDGVTNWLTGDWKECEGYRGYVCSPFLVRESGHRSTIGWRAT
jgi:hypothetical protein